MFAHSRVDLIDFFLVFMYSYTYNSNTHVHVHTHLHVRVTGDTSWLRSEVKSLHYYNYEYYNR